LAQLSPSQQLLGSVQATPAGAQQRWAQLQPAMQAAQALPSLPQAITSLPPVHAPLAQQPPLHGEWLASPQAVSQLLVEVLQA
jgi:hypothetical protein